MRFVFTLVVVLLFALPAWSGGRLQLVELDPGLRIDSLVVSGNGRRILGSFSEFGGERGRTAFRLSRRRGLRPLRSIDSRAQIEHVSFDGSVIVYAVDREARFRGFGQDAPIPSMPGITLNAGVGTAGALSADGRIFATVAGAESGGPLRAFTANLETGETELFEPMRRPFEGAPFLLSEPVLEVWATTRHGDVFVGTGLGGTQPIPLVFDRDFATRLDDLSGGRVEQGIAFDVTPDGEVIAGNARADTPQGLIRGTFRYESGALESLGVAAWNRLHLTSDGDGIAFNPVSEGFPSTNARNPSYWSRSIGVVSIEEFVTTELGVDLGGYSFDELTGISDDGRVLVGTARRSQDERAIWALRLDRRIEAEFKGPRKRARRAAAWIRCILGDRSGRPLERCGLPPGFDSRARRR